ncbi:phosphoribosyl-AMP cyclohydrolase [Candidatus Poribacteria bacterium]|nr:phosphoribosyl-AMP cyclohydrolase [Candidatus Poribacteria bacterium]
MEDEIFPELDFQKRGGFIVTITQDIDTGEVLMVAYSNQESLKKALDMKQGIYWSTSRNELWHKGATSGNIQELVKVLYDCDGDALVFKVKPQGPACHTGERTCFYRTLWDNKAK